MVPFTVRDSLQIASLSLQLMSTNVFTFIVSVYTEGFTVRVMFTVRVWKVDIICNLFMNLQLASSLQLTS